MATVDDVQTTINQLSAMLVEITASPQPSYSVQGVSVSWSEYKDSLIKNIADLQEVLIFLSGPYQMVTVGVS